MNMQKIISFSVILFLFFTRTVACGFLDSFRSSFGRDLDALDKRLFTQRRALSENTIGKPLHLECKQKVAVSLLKALKVCILARVRLNKWNDAGKITVDLKGEASGLSLVIENKIEIIKRELAPFVVLTQFKTLLSQVFKCSMAEVTIYDCLMKEHQAISLRCDEEACRRRK